MLPEELIKRIRQIQIYTSRAVDASFAGQYESVFKGRGMQFDEVREYMPGDEIRTIDWNVTARTGRPFIKRFVEEREMTVLFAVDLSASGEFGTVSKLKNELAAEFCAVLAFAAAKNNDKVGLLIFTDRIELFIPPKKGSRHILRLIRELLGFTMPKRRTNIPLALDYIAKVVRKRATVFLVSDFIETGFQKPLSLLNKRHDVIAVPVRDRVEVAMPAVGLIEVQDAETGQIMLVDTSSRCFRTRYGEHSSRRFNELTNTLRSANVDLIPIATDKPYINDLIQFFHMRHRRH
ncbi:MAG: DUF58 domain-containing protein [Sedimentisphaerales bacterium]|jgi:uncharacterized protein (DUF58 family)|nr:DUF58 domain-containing protein [Sedimentisphaerales bacterium]HNY78026.1 DUF58 domain-containing protein [Sedimentisphaerales bacterium]HOC63256.1 DUF58 domain-containing protein [Sedimentisphaerales bacterium]HOH64201.1 DUF58 domain-containing protein [Sedimentisphaerales bacterium]HPY50357.1 DUF58 domain-containing protein [Sedimentisphaerales bacterium]